MLIYTNNSLTGTRNNIAPRLSFLINKYMTKKGYTVSLLAVLSVCFFTACKRTDIQFGDDFIDNDYTKIIKTDSFTVNVSTVYIDSFATSGSGTALAGVYKDKDFGLIRARTFMQLAPPASADIYDNTSYDSTRLVVKLNRTWYGDTSKPLHIVVYRVTDDINFPEDASQFYNTTSFNTASTPIGEQTVYLKPNVIDSTISIPISDALGNEWMNLLQTKSDDVKTTENFLQYFKGIAITATGDDGVVRRKLQHTERHEAVTAEPALQHPAVGASFRKRNERGARDVASAPDRRMVRARDQRQPLRENRNVFERRRRRRFGDERGIELPLRKLPQ